jgi:hypothetical protein
MSSSESDKDEKEEEEEEEESGRAANGGGNFTPDLAGLNYRAFPGHIVPADTKQAVPKPHSGVGDEVDSSSAGPAKSDGEGLGTISTDDICACRCDTRF